MAVPAWHSGLTKQQTADIERVQKVAVQVILSNCTTGKSDLSYGMALSALGLDPLQARREKLCLKFAKKSLSSRHSDIFSENGSNHLTRKRPKFFEKKCNTKRFYNSPVNFLTRLLNNS